MSQTSLIPVTGEPAPSADSGDCCKSGPWQRNGCAESLSCNLEETHLHFGADKILVCACQQRHHAKPAQEPGHLLLPLACAQDSVGQQCVKAWAKTADAGLPAQYPINYIGYEKNLKI